MNNSEHSFIVSSDIPIRLDKYLSQVLENKSRTQIQQLINGGFVKVNQVVKTKNSFKLTEGDQVSVRIPPKAPSQLEPAQLKLDIIFETDDIILINKPPDLVVHPSPGHSSGTLVQGILGHIPDIEGVGDEKRPGVVHRLDKDTSGVIIFAKNDSAHQFLQAQFMDRTIEKTYLAIVDGFPPTPTGRIDAAIGRDPKNRQKMAIVQDDQGKKALSQYKVIEQYEQHSLIEIKIFTGRTHQIRLHLSFVGCPVVGDKLYGRMKNTTEAKRQMLHAWKLGFSIPDLKEFREFVAEIPEDFETILEALRNQRR